MTEGISNEAGNLVSIKDYMIASRNMRGRLPITVERTFQENPHYARVVIRLKKLTAESQTWIHDQNLPPSSRPDSKTSTHHTVDRGNPDKDKWDKLDFLTTVTDILAKQIEISRIKSESPKPITDSEIAGKIPDSYSQAFSSPGEQKHFEDLIIKEYLNSDIHDPESGQAVLDTAYNYWRTHTTSNPIPYDPTNSPAEPQPNPVRDWIVNKTARLWSFRDTNLPDRLPGNTQSAGDD